MGVVDGSRVRREGIVPGRLQGKGMGEIADYVLICRNTKEAVAETMITAAQYLVPVA